MYISNISRRHFITQLTLGSITAPTILNSSVFGANNRINLGCIGVGNMGTNNLKSFLNKSAVQVVAVCDVDHKRARDAQKRVNTHYNNSDCTVYDDFRELNQRQDIDAVIICTPDHWHILPALDAIKNGKDTYIEKPLSLTVKEGRALCDHANQYKKIVQTGSQQRSSERFRLACELVRNGRIGEIKDVKVTIPGNNRTCAPTWIPLSAPKELNYDMWLGPAPYAPYTEQRCHYQFRFILDYSGGQVTNWGAHYLDIAQWALNMDDSGPVKIYGKGEFPQTGLFNTATHVDFTCLYKNGIKLTCKTSKSHGITFEGSRGWLYVDRGRIKSNPDSILEEPIYPSDIHLYKSNNHQQNFLDCIRTRELPIANHEVGHRSATVCHLGNISMLLKRPLNWDPKNETFENDSEANTMRSRPMRPPWRL